MTFSAQSKVGDLLANDSAKAVLEKHMPGFSSHPQIGMAKGMSLQAVANFSGGKITKDMIAGVEADLAALG